MNKILFALPLLFAVGCGVSDDTLLNEIDEDLWGKICDKATADSVAETYTCDGVEITVDPVTSQQCVDANKSAWDADCTATFGDWKTCQDFEFADPCAPDLDAYAAACGPLTDCAM